MAGAAEKKQAQRNIETLSSIHKLSGIVNLISLLCIFFLQRPLNGKKYYFLLSIPAYVCQYIVENIGRPSFKINEDGYKVLVKAGEDLQQAGLTEYMFDIIYLTLSIDLLMCIFGTMKVWLLLAIVPIYACWKLKGVISTILSMFLPNLKSKRSNAGSEETKVPVEKKSKRQQKMEKRAAKSQQQVRYRWSFIYIRFGD